MFKRLKSLVIDELEKREIIIGSIHRSDRAGMLYKAWGHVFTSHLQGDYVEFGVYRGDSLIKSYKEYTKFKKWLKGQMTSDEKWRREIASHYIDEKVKFHALDTFAGMPANDEGNITFKEGVFLSDIEKVKGLCRKEGLEDSDVIFYEGLFSDTAAKLNENLKGRKISILNIDCDLYISTKTALEVSMPYLSLGSVILFDDYNTYGASNTKGERKAFREFQLESELIWEPWQAYHFSGQAFLCVDRK